MEKQTNKLVKCIRNDNGVECINRTFASLCRDAGIVHQTTASYSPQQNGLAERMNRKLMERAQSIVHYKCAEKSGETKQ